MITIDTAALQHNLARVRALAPQSKILAMIKSDGYGHGLLTVAQALSSAEGFGVAHLSEALSLRQAGFQQKIVWMEGFNDRDTLNICITHQIDPVIHQDHQIEILEQYPSQTIQPWLKLDTGMHRLGFLPHDFLTAHQRILNCQPMANITLMSHFSNVFSENPQATKLQIQTFKQLTAHLPGEKSLANSGGILRYPDSHCDWVRPGIMLYGASPFDHSCGQDFNLQATMQFETVLLAKKILPKGSPIGYGGRFICPEDMLVGIIPVGYGDGYPRHIQNYTPVILRNKCCNILGTVSMNLISIDLRDCPDANIGDSVLLWGDKLPIETIADHAGTISYELLTQVRRT